MAAALTAGAAETTNTPATIRLAVTLTDGSLLKGEPKTAGLGIESTLGTFNLDFERLSSVMLQPVDGQPNVELLLRNGNRVTGRLTVTHLPLTTCVGDVRLPVTILKAIRVSRTAGSGGVPQAGLVLRWTFDEAGAEELLADASGAGHHGRGSNVERSPDGKVGGALRCNGRDPVASCPEGLAETMPAITLAAWVQLDRQRYAPVIEFSRNDGQYGPHMWVTTGGGLYVNFWGRPTNDRNILTGGQLFKADEWVHVACTYDGETGVVYVNGVEVGRKSWEKLVLETKYPFSVGGRRGWRASNPSLSGLVDEVVVYDRALSAAEIKALAER